MGRPTTPMIDCDRLRSTAIDTSKDGDDEEAIRAGRFGQVAGSWSQSRERRIGEFLKRKTDMFNGYQEQVAHLYTGMDLKKHF